ncbi:MAG: hypothetical protein K2K16_13015 [Ruminococcus sp.]|nr:hypothetical protein [Ruminococcus sp.]
MADKNVIAIRADEETKAKFKAIAETFENNGIALESLLNAYEMQTAKDKLTVRRTDIEDFDIHLQAISSAFLHSLEITENTTERVRAEFQNKLESKDRTISDLQQKLHQAEQAMKTADKQAESAKNDLAETDTRYSVRIQQLENELYTATNAVSQAESALKDKQTIIDSLTVENVKLRDEAQRTEIAETALKTSETRIKELESTIDLERQKSANELEKAVLQAERTATAELKKLTDETAKAKEKLLVTIAELNEKVASAQQKSQEKQDIIDNLKEKISQLEKEILKFTK